MNSFTPLRLDRSAPQNMTHKLACIIPYGEGAVGTGWTSGADRAGHTVPRAPAVRGYVSIVEATRRRGKVRGERTMMDLDAMINALGASGPHADLADRLTLVGPFVGAWGSNEGGN